MRNCNFPVPDQHLVQFGKILPVLDQLLVPFGPIWTNFTCFRQKFVEIGLKVGLKQENCIFPFRTSAFSRRRPKKFFECKFGRIVTEVRVEYYYTSIISSRPKSFIVLKQHKKGNPWSQSTSSAVYGKVTPPLPLLVVLIYRPPDVKIWSDLQLFCLLRSFYSEFSNKIIMGDLNAYMLNDSNSDTKCIRDLMDELSL